MAQPGAEAIKLTNETIRAARALGGQPRVAFDVTGGGVREVTAEVVLTSEQAAVVAGRLDVLRALEDVKP